MDELKNIDINVTRIGTEQTKDFETLKQKIQKIEENQKVINGNLDLLSTKLDIIMNTLKKNFPE